MILRTELPSKPGDWSIPLSMPVLTLGSCFAQSMGQKLTNHKFETLVNPFGTTYHPFSIHKLLKYAAWQETPADHTYIDHSDIVFNYDIHSSLSAPDRHALQKQLAEVVGVTHYFLKRCGVLMLTYGTAWIYERVDTGEPVANCHKMPSALFSKRLASVDEIQDSFLETLKILRSIQPNLKVILTVSPVRHIKDSLPLNSVSKSILRVACHQMMTKQENVEYFPAFEFMMDDLRDYRFYKEDLIHPNETAENYIWEKFCSAYFSPATVSILKKWDEVRRSIHHQPFHPGSKAHQKFLVETLRQLNELKSILNVEEEIKIINSQLLEKINS